MAARAKQEKPARRRWRIDYVQFVKHWTLAQSAQEVADKLSVPLGTVQQTARKLRDSGVHLKQMPRNPIDVKTLNAIIDEVEDS